ncbi:MAG: HAD family hydrolase [Gammaproteobacteria bacterium]|nr:HAD family hydrolase [Gammaproteobacteria bacterium]
MGLALFDLDNTLLAGDSDYEWGRFLVDRGVVNAAVYERENRHFYAQYNAGTLDIHEFARFAYGPLAVNSLATLDRWRAAYVEERIAPLILPRGRALIEQHRDAGRVPVIITSTNRFIAEPIAQALSVDHLLATEPEFIDGRYTGELAGIPCFREGKVARLRAWLGQTGLDLNDSWFYSDSHNDLPLLELVDHPVAVDADETLTAHARMRGWPIISLRDGSRDSHSSDY